MLLHEFDVPHEAFTPEVMACLPPEGWVWVRAMLMWLGGWAIALSCWHCWHCGRCWRCWRISCFMWSGASDRCGLLLSYDTMPLSSPITTQHTNISPLTNIWTYKNILLYIYSWKITEEVVAQRTDLRHIPVVSIDPPGCKDIDDALHCVRLPNGRLEAGVHIADVTFFVHPDTPLDKEAAHRATSTYLVERRLDMLPGLLTTELCSLRANEDHLAFR